MLSSTALFLPTLLVTSQVAFAQYTATYTPENAPDKSEQGQSGTNQCGTGSDPNSMCQNAFINSATDFCLWAPPSTTSDEGDGTSKIGNTERVEVAWCTKGGRGTRVIPEGAITGAHFVKTPHYIQLTGVGDLTKMNIPAGDDGGELDPHGADGNGNPIGGLVFSDAFGQGTRQIHEWTNFMGSDFFCFRACNPDDPEAAQYCEHIYDTLGCGWNQPGNYDAGSFDECDADAVEKPGVYSGSTFHQGDASTPAAHPAGATSNCQQVTLSANAQVQAILPTAASSVVADVSSVVSSAFASPSASASSMASATSSASASGSSASSSASASSNSGSSMSSMSSMMSSSSRAASASSSTPRPSGSGSGALASASGAAASILPSGNTSEAFSKVPLIAGTAFVGVLAAVGSFFYL